MATLLQWNCRGFRANRSDIDLLIQRYSPVAICLQETLLTNITYTIPQYVPYHIFASLDNNNRPHGGVSIFVKSNIPQRKISLDTDIPAVAVSLTHGKKFTLCSIYLNPRNNITLEDLYHLTEQLPKPYILLGDFNAHNTLWGDSNTDQKGGIIEELLNIQQLCLWNDGTPTYLHPATGTRTCIDLSISHSSLHLDYTWHVHEELRIPVEVTIFPLSSGHAWIYQRRNCKDGNSTKPIGFFFHNFVCLNSIRSITSQMKIQSISLLRH